MPATFNQKAQFEQIREEIKINDSDSFVVLLTPPTFEHLLNDSENLYGYQLQRFKKCVVGWEELNDQNGEPLPFHYATFTRLCEQFPGVFQQVAAALQRLFVRLSEEQLGNSKTPSAESSTERQSEMEQTTKAAE